jgi:hypothetical protein
MRFYRWLLRFIQILVVLVVLPRVASFLGLLTADTGFSIHTIIRFAFAATLGLGTIATAYFSEHIDPPEYDEEPSNPREQKRREREAIYFATMNNAAPVARMAMLFFALLDGTFNCADAFYGASKSGLLDSTVNGSLVYVYGAAVFLFGVSPTLLSIVLARVITSVDRIPIGFDKPAGKHQIDLLATIMGNAGLKAYTRSDAAHLLTSEDAERLPANTPGPNGVRRTANNVRRIPNGNGYDQRTRIVEYLNEHPTESVSQIQNGLGEPIPSRSTVSTVRSEWQGSRN